MLRNTTTTATTTTATTIIITTIIIIITHGSGCVCTVIILPHIPQSSHAKPPEQILPAAAAEGVIPLAMTTLEIRHVLDLYGHRLKQRHIKFHTYMKAVYIKYMYTA
jgi:hypothetical protein